MSNLEANRLELRSDLAELKRLAGWLKAQAQQELSASTHSPRVGFDGRGERFTAMNDAPVT
jgi:hypothetical protein